MVGTARSPETSRLQMEAKRGSPSPFAWVEMDCSIPDSIQRGFDQAHKLLGGIDILINNAGYGELGSVEDTDLSASRRLFEVNYFSAVSLIKKVLPSMRENRSGVIINLGSIVQELHFPFKAQYCASKAALAAFSQSLRYELFPFGIRVHILEPGWVRTHFHEHLVPVIKPGSVYAEKLKPYLDFSRDTNPSIPDGEDVARMILSVLEKPNSPVRIPVGREAKTFQIVRRVLGPALLDKLLLWKLGKKGQSL